MFASTLLAMLLLPEGPSGGNPPGGSPLGNKFSGGAHAAPAGVVRVTDHLRIWHRRNRRADVVLAVVLHRRVASATVGFTPHQGDLRARGRVLLVDDAKRQLRARVVAEAREHRVANEPA